MIVHCVITQQNPFFMDHLKNAAKVALSLREVWSQVRASFTQKHEGKGLEKSSHNTGVITYQGGLSSGWYLIQR